MGKRAAEREGITKVPPKTEAQEGFGMLPDASEWKPGFSKYPREVGEELRDSFKSMPEREGVKHTVISEIEASRRLKTGLVRC